MRAHLRQLHHRFPSSFQHTRSLTTRPLRLPRYASRPPIKLQFPAPPLSQEAEEDGARATESDGRQKALTYAAFKARRQARNKAKGLTVDPAIGREFAMERIKKCISLARNGRVRSEILQGQLWRAYSLAKAHGPDMLQHFPEATWDLLFASPSIKSRRTRHSRAHVIELYQDMLSVGIVPSTDQKIAYMESLFQNGAEQLALQEWRLCCGGLKFPECLLAEPALVESGARMHALAGHLEEARGVMDQLFHLHPQWDPSVMLAVFKAHTASSVDRHQKGAWAIYERMKEIFGEERKRTVYDYCFNRFVEADQLFYAKRVFWDMVKVGYLATTLSDEDIHRVLEKLNLLYSLASDLTKATGIATLAITILPKAYLSYVFGHWLRLAVIRNAPEAAAQILDMMYARGCEPQTLHYNLLLRLFFRAESKVHKLKAENIAWHMVDVAGKAHSKANRLRSAVDAVRQYEEHGQGESATLSSVRKVPTETEKRDVLLQKIPPADATTFGLLMKYHANRSQWEHVGYLARRLKELNVPPNTEVMNAMMDHRCRQGKYNDVWGIYHSMTNPPEDVPGVFPNGASFRCLWKALRLALGDPATRENCTLPRPRQLLAENIRWWDLVRRRSDAKRFLVGLAAQDLLALNMLIMHSFSYTKDLAGSLVAMHALRTCFKVLPSKSAAEVLHKQIAWVDMNQETASVRAQYSHAGVLKRKLEQMGHIYSVLLDARLKRKNITAEQYEHLTDEQSADLTLDCLSEFTRAVLKRQHPPEIVEAMINQAKKDIGLPDLRTGDMDAFAVA